MYWNWMKGGVALGVCFLFAIALMKPIGVSTQFVILDGIIANKLDSTLISKEPTSKTGYTSRNAYLNKSEGKYAKAVAHPLNYSFMFVLSMFLGGLIGRWIGNQRNQEKLNQIPAFHKERFGNSSVIRYLLSFVGGVIVLFGARLAGGCTSGHMMSGMMQTAISGYVFAAAAFAAAVPMTILVYRK